MNIDPNPDWAEVIRDLIRCGYTQTMIAQACECTQSRISELANFDRRVAERGPHFVLGMRLLTLRHNARPVPASQAKRRKASA